MSIDYYGNGQHALHVDEATIEDDNGTFTCLALNADGRVQITADVFVHEKGKTRTDIYIYLHPFFSSFSHKIEIIDLPRNSPLVLKQKKILIKQKSKEYLNMNVSGNPPLVSPPMSPLLTSSQNDKEEENNAKRFMDKFRNDRSSKLLESKF